MTIAYQVGLVVAKAGLSEHQARELGNLMRSWAKQAGVYRIHVWGGSIELVWDHVRKDSAYGYLHTWPEVPNVERLKQLDEVWALPASSSTLCNPDKPLRCWLELQNVGYTHARRIDAWTNEHRARGGR